MPALRGGAVLNHYLLNLYRSLIRHRLYAALNVLGLAVGIAVFLVLMLDVRFETRFERWIPDASQIYIVRTSFIQSGGAGEFYATMGGFLDELRGDYPQIVGTRYWDQAATIREGGRATAEQVDVVDPTFFKVFDLPMARGDKATLLNSPDQLVLTQAKARRYFGAADPIGRRLTLVFLGAPRIYRVAGVLKDPPRSTDWRWDFLVPFTPAMADGDKSWRHWGNISLYTFLRFDRPAAAKALDGDLDRFTDRHADANPSWPPPAHKALRLRTLPFVALHFDNSKTAPVVAALGVVGLLTLLLAAVNYLNLATARAGLRAREVALRKVMGATRQALVLQFMGEAVVTALLAALIGLALCELALPLVNAAGGLALRIDYLGKESVGPFLLATVIAVGLGAGLYPALVLSRFQPAAVLAATLTPGGGRAGARVRAILVVFQFAIAIVFTIATGVIVSQTGYLRRTDLGFRRDGLMVVSAFDNSEITGAQRAGLLDAWRALPGVVGATSATIAPGNEETTNQGGLKRPGTAGDGVQVNDVRIGPGFFQTYGARLVAGRFLDSDHGSDDPLPPLPSADPSAPPAMRDIVLDTGALRPLGFRDAHDAIGKPLLEGLRGDPLTVIGVIDPIRFRSPHTPTPPTYYLFSTRDFEGQVAAVRYVGVDPRVVAARMENAWRRIAPTVPFQAKTVEDSLQRYYRHDDQSARLFTIGAALAVAIGCVGLYGLASFTTARRVHEIGIRKTLGATTGDILRLLVGQFLRPVLLANLVAWPLAWLAMRSWLSGFDQRIGLSPAYFLAATLLTLVIAVGTVAGQALAVARAEPAKALRNE